MERRTHYGGCRNCRRPEGITRGYGSNTHYVELEGHLLSRRISPNLPDICGERLMLAVCIDRSEVNACLELLKAVIESSGIAQAELAKVLDIEQGTARARSPWITPSVAQLRMRRISLGSVSNF
jgi:hypothetical protein